MNTDVLFDRAFAIRAAKPWQYLFDTHIFAVRFSDGEIACCSVMGRNGTHLALALYSLTDGLYALDKLMTTDMRVLPRHRAEECMLGQDCSGILRECAGNPREGGKARPRLRQSTRHFPARAAQFSGFPSLSSIAHAVGAD